MCSHSSLIQDRVTDKRGVQIMSKTNIMRMTDPFGRGARLYPKNLVAVDVNHSLK